MLAQAMGAGEAEAGAALARLRESGEAMEPIAGRWLAAARWNEARERIAREVREFAARHPARFGVMKGDLKSGLKTALDASLFDAAYDALLAERAIEQRGERVRPTGTPWTPPAEMLAALESVERELETTGLAVPESAAWQAKLGANAAEVVALGAFLGRLARVSQEFTYTTRQLDDLRAKLAAHFARRPTMNVAEFKELAGVSRKYAVPLLEHGDRVGWTVRAGDDRKPGARLNAAPAEAPRP